MKFSEKLYTLRKNKGLSQEQLAESLNVSRQAVSKWESGAAMPETEKLLAISKFFGVSMDYLMKDGVPQESAQPSVKKAASLPGLVLCISGAVCLILYGLISMISPEAGDNLSQSSMVTIDGSGLLLIACAAAVIVGSVLLLKDQK